MDCYQGGVPRLCRGYVHIYICIYVCICIVIQGCYRILQASNGIYIYICTYALRVCIN